MIDALLFLLSGCVIALLVWAWPTDYLGPTQRRNPYKYMKNHMMREGHLSARQWRLFRKRMKHG